MVIDGHALIQSLGKPKDSVTFGDYAEVFFKAATRHFNNPGVKRIDVVFDRYKENSIKTPTRMKRTGKKRPIRKIVDSEEVVLPQVWAQFIALEENKADLAFFLSEALMVKGAGLAEDQEIITSGGFDDENISKSTRRDIPDLCANHEEADTRIILHTLEAASQGFRKVEVLCRDTDVLLMLIHFCGNIDLQVWMVSGTAKQRKCYPVHQIAEKLSPPIIENILGFHALTGCDTTSSFSGFGKKKCWKVFVEKPNLLSGIGRDGLIDMAEEYVCHLYGVPDPTMGCDKGRHDLFVKGKKDLDKLPPTKDALHLHCKRANYQAKIWLHANLPQMNIESPYACEGWKNSPSGITISWSTLPSVPSACIELVACGCKTKCKTASCKCSKTGQVCIPACSCNAENCCNPAGLDTDSESEED